MMTTAQFPGLRSVGMAKRLTKAKAKKMLRENQAQGKPLTKKQKGYFGAVAGGQSKGPKPKKNREK